MYFVTINLATIFIGDKRLLRCIQNRLIVFNKIIQFHVLIGILFMIIIVFCDLLRKLKLKVDFNLNKKVEEKLIKKL